jgi:hypothetical protein
MGSRTSELTVEYVTAQTLLIPNCLFLAFLLLTDTIIRMMRAMIAAAPTHDPTYWLSHLTSNLIPQSMSERDIPIIGPR